MVNYDFLSVYFYSVPNLRFSYKGDWSKRKLNEICQFFKGNGLSKSDLSNEGFPCILYGELYTTYKNEVISDIISKTNTTLSNPFLSRNNDLIIPGSGEDPIDIAVARAICQNDIILGGDLNILRPKSNVSAAFLSYQLNGVRRYDIAKKAQGKSIVHLHNSDLKEVLVSIPTYNEQLHIVKLLTKVDEMIETQSKIINDYKILKNHIIKSYIKQNGTSYLLSEIAELGRGRVINSAEISKQKNPIYPVYSSQTSNNGIMGYLDNYDYEGEYITWTTDGANAGTVYYRNGKFNCTNVCGILKIKNGYDAYYISNILNCYTKKYVSTNLANPKLMNNVMANIKINLPSIEQQKHSSKILQSIEYRVEIEEDIKLNLVKQKAFLLKNMFI